MSSRVVVAVVENDGLFLLVRRRLKEQSLHWQFPSGGIEEGELDERAAERETLEETGVVCKATRKLGERVHPNTGREMVYWLCEYVSGEAKVCDEDELDRVEWGYAEKVFELITTDIFAPVKQYLEQRRGKKGCSLKPS